MPLECLFAKVCDEFDDCCRDCEEEGYYEADCHWGGAGNSGDWGRSVIGKVWGRWFGL